ncbi:hypothetical protein FJT64_012796 [Amphibalanus amphitrite]|uniref:Integrase zinc-binding domain-containing protein n=1 Tax=Amphibalanus amphitrite TaxID=1232801 RepID=A0A6A4VET1_AMPAM|nr:hypothetical protein FJT64_012796 [Amphibalanus amphitrite]
MEKEDTWMDEMYDIFSTTKKAFFSFNNETMKNVKEETGTNEQNIKQPEIQKLKMPLFSGTQDDVMSFNDFLKMFDDLIGNNSAYNQSAKLMYLKSYLRGNALDTIKHLSTEEKNYTIARKFLTEEYLDTDVIVEEHIRKLHDLTPPPARDLPALRAFFNTARTSVYELKAFGYDALEDGTLGSKIVSFIICEKLPVNFKVKLSAILHTDYPSTRQLLENFNAVIKSLMKTTPAKQETKHTTDLSSKPKQLKTTEVTGSAKPAKSSLQRFQTSAEPIKKTPSHSTSKFKACKLCEGAHSMLKCSAYTSPRTRIQRLKDLELCTKCSGSHKLTDCKSQTSGLSYPCTLCGSKQHISAVCVVKPGETTPLQSGMRLICNSLQKGQTVLLPSMTVIMHNGERSELVRCMIDVGSQASYISEELAVKLGCPLEAPKTTYKVKTCIGVQEKNYRTATSDIIFTPTASAHHCFLVDPEMSLEYEIPGVTSLVQFLRAQGVRLADSFFSHSTNDVIGGFECLLGADIIGAIKPMRSVDLGTGTAFEVQDGLILFGSVDGYFEQLNLKENTEHDEDLHVGNRKLEHLFSIESLGIRETDESVSARERRLVEEFSNEVELRDGKYFVRVPFYDSVTKVPGNHDVALATMKKVRNKLAKRGLADSYTAVFEQQLRDGIIEEVDYNKPSTNQRVFIPHHPVVKTDAQTTTKIRPVFNCSLKIGDRPSLNEACFRGVDLLNDLVTLLMRFRTNKHILLADIEKAFLQIYLKYEEDKDKFCFLWETDDGLKMYRFRTILFGLNCSPFILSHIIQIHLSKYSTTDGGYSAQGVAHGAVTEKVLGYLYDAKQDTISLSDFNFEENQQGITKRQLLSNISKVFDPLSLALPVTIRGRILMKQVWTEGTAWDEDVSPAVLAEWQRLKKDLLSLREFQFSRETGDTESGQPTDLHLFCDGSKTSYGFACYLKQEGSDPQLVFAKSKLAPDNRSIPQMELLAVFLALKCLPLIIDSINASIRHVRLWSDAQVVLEWLASGCKSKSKFTANRLEDITAMKLKLHHQHQVEVTHHYVSTDSNVADMLTRGLSAKEFHKKLAVWCHGPDWLGDHPEQWPKSPLHCLSEEGKVMVELQQHHQQVEINTEAQTPATQTILSIKDFSSLRRLHGVTARVFHFVNVLKHREADAKEQATHYWLKVMQENAFTEEISYLQDKQENKLVNSASVPKLVKELNVFIDKSGLLRCRGRLSKLNRYSYAVHNPILLDKTHRLTTLMIEDQHRRCKHLGVGTTLTELREHGYWIPSGRQVVKRVLKDCITCQKLNALAFEYPKMTNLPRERPPA